MLDIFVISISEYDNYIISQDDEDSITDIRGVYLFDKSDSTGGISTYKLALIYMKIIFTEEGQNLAEWERTFLQEKYSADAFGDIDYPYHEIDDFIDHPEHFPLHRPEIIHFGDIKVGIGFDNHDDIVEGTALIEMIRTYFQVNPPF